MITRINRSGIAFVLVAEDADHTKVSLGNKSIVVDCPLDEMTARWYHWMMKGAHVQYAFDNLNADEREFLITGITPAEWKEIFKDEE